MPRPPRCWSRRAPPARVQDVTVPAADGTPLPARPYAPSRDRLQVLLYLHGGGYTIGGLETHDSLCRQLALRTGGAVLALAYRLAPEHRFPTAVDDAWAAMRRLAAEGAQAPLLADDLEGVAPACMLLAECDPLVDEGIADADRLRMAGVPVALDLARGMTHDFIKMGRVLPEAAVAQQLAADALREAWTIAP